MTDNDRIAELVKERAQLKRERCCLRKELDRAGSLFASYHNTIKTVLESNYPKASEVRFAPNLTSNELEEKFHRIAEIEEQIKEIEDCVPDLKA